MRAWLVGGAVAGASLGALALAALEWRSLERDLRATIFVERPAPILHLSVDAPGLPAEEVDASVGKALEAALAGRSLRLVAREGRAEATIELAPGADPKPAASEVLSAARTARPGVACWTERAEPVELLLRSKNLTGVQVRSLADELEPALLAVPGVESTRVVGGARAELAVTIDARALAATGLALTHVLDAVSRTVSATGGRFALRDFEDVTIAVVNGVPIRIKDVAQLELRQERTHAVLDRSGEAVLLEAEPAAAAEVRKSMGALRERLPASAELAPLGEPVLLAEAAMFGVLGAVFVGAGVALLAALATLGNPRALLAALGAVLVAATLARLARSVPPFAALAAVLAVLIEVAISSVWRPWRGRSDLVLALLHRASFAAVATVTLGPLILDQGSPRFAQLFFAAAIPAALVTAVLLGSFGLGLLLLLERLAGPPTTRGRAAFARRAAFVVLAGLSLCLLAKLPAGPSLEERTLLVATDAPIQRVREAFARVPEVTEFAVRTALHDERTEATVALAPGAVPERVAAALRHELSPSHACLARTPLDARVEIEVRLEGPDLPALARASASVEQALVGLSGVDFVHREASAAPALRLELDEKRLAALGVDPARAELTARAARSGVAFVATGGRTVLVRLSAGNSDDERLSVPVEREGGGALPLREVARAVAGETVTAVERLNGAKGVSVRATLTSGNDAHVRAAVRSVRLPEGARLLLLRHEANGPARPGRSLAFLAAAGAAFALLALAWAAPRGPSKHRPR